MKELKLWQVVFPKDGCNTSYPTHCSRTLPYLHQGMPSNSCGLDLKGFCDCIHQDSMWLLKLGHQRQYCCFTCWSNCPGTLSYHISNLIAQRPPCCGAAQTRLWRDHTGYPNKRERSPVSAHLLQSPLFQLWLPSDYNLMTSPSSSKVIKWLLWFQVIKFGGWLGA